MQPLKIPVVVVNDSAVYMLHIYYLVVLVCPRCDVLCCVCSRLVIIYALICLCFEVVVVPLVFSIDCVI